MAKQTNESHSSESRHAAPDTAAAKNTLTHDQLNHFTGDLDRYRHTLNRRVIYTPGVQFLAECAGAYWLIDVIASYLTPQFIEQAAQADERISWMTQIESIAAATSHFAPT